MLYLPQMFLQFSHFVLEILKDISRVLAIHKRSNNDELK